jgi:hypothetical protein
MLKLSVSVFIDAPPAVGWDRLAKLEDIQVMEQAFLRMGSNLLIAFKYLVETGRPFAGTHSELPRAAAMC